MTYVFDPELQIAAGHNNAAGLVSIASIIAPGDSRPFVAPSAWFNYSPGEFLIRLDQTRYIRGTPNTAFIFSFMTKNQWVYLSDTYCGGGYTGNVTIRTRLRDPNNYSNNNAIMYLPSPAETTPRLGRIGNSIRISLVALEGI